MKELTCNKHSLTVVIPSTDDEFLSGKYHHNVESFQLHHQQFPECRFIECENRS